MLRFDHLALRRGPLLLIQDMDLALHAGWRVGIAGRNGAGKSSLLALIAGEIAPDAGHFELGGDARIKRKNPQLSREGLGNKVAAGHRHHLSLCSLTCLSIQLLLSDQTHGNMIRCVGEFVDSKTCVTVSGGIHTSSSFLPGVWI